MGNPARVIRTLSRARPGIRRACHDGLPCCPFGLGRLARRAGRQLVAAGPDPADEPADPGRLRLGQTPGHSWRLARPEARLHLLELCGGWPGALVARQWLRHKTQKGSYRLRFWAIVWGQLLLLGIWLGWPLWPL